VQNCLGFVRVSSVLLFLTALVVAAIASDRSISPDQMARAARSGDLATLEAALDQDLPIDCRNLDGLTPLMESARAGNLTAARFLVNHGADLEARVPCMGTSLSIAACNSQPRILELLLAHHANPNAVADGGVTPLMYAAICNNGAEEMTRALLAAGADPHAVSSTGWTARAAALDSNNPTLMKLLK
jgi:ankyrin repeat protein